MTTSEFSQFVQHYQQPLVAMIYRFIGHWEQARDIAQESFLRFWKMQSRLNPEKSYYALLSKIAVNLSIDYLRKTPQRMVTAEIENELYPGMDDESTHLDDQEIRQCILHCARKLSPIQQSVFILRDMEGFTIEEIAQVLLVSRENVRVQLHYARKK